MTPIKPRSRVVFLWTLFTLSLSWMGSSAWAAGRPPNNTPHRVTTWNLQNGASNKWVQILRMSRDQYVFALQEASTAQPAHTVATNRQGLPAGVVEYYSPADRSNGNQERYIYILQTTSRNLAMVTAYRAPAVYVIDSVYRPALATVDPVSGVLFASIHAESGTGNAAGNDVGAILRRIDRFSHDSGHSFWCAMGDFNRQPEDLGDMLPAGTQYFRSGQATHINGRELDYMVCNFDPGQEQWAATVGAAEDSDHWPVYFSPLRAEGERPEVLIQSRRTGHVLDIRADNHAPGTPVIGHQPTGAPNQLWMLDALGSAPGDNRTFYQIYSPDTQLCLDFERHVEGPGQPGSQYFAAPALTKLCDVPPFSGGRTGQTQQHFSLVPLPGSPDHNAVNLFDEWGGFLSDNEVWNGSNKDPDDGIAHFPAKPNDPSQIFFLHPVIKNP